jgi:hypothetical protein
MLENERRVRSNKKSRLLVRFFSLVVVTNTCNFMIVDLTGGLKVRVDGCGAYKLHAELLEVFGYLIGQWRGS